MSRTKAQTQKMYPAFVGFWTTEAQRKKLEELMQQSGRNLGQVCRILVDKAVLRVIDIDLDPSPPTSPKHAA
jgi:hypothetical protein